MRCAWKYYPNTTQVEHIEMTNVGYVEVTQSGAKMSAPAISRHSFFSLPNPGFGGINPPNGGPANSLAVRTTGLGFPDLYEGKEYKVEVPGLRTVEHVWGGV